MKSLILLIFLFATASCFDNPATHYDPAPCHMQATVVDYTGTDGCGLLLELSGGRRLEPIRLVYIHAPTPEEDPIYYYQLTAGEKVYISFNEYEGVSACMMGDLVFITCIRSAESE